MNMLVPDSGQAEAGLVRSARSSSQPVIIAASHSWGGRAASAVQDLRESLRLWPLVWTLSLFDIRLRYRGSLLGPFWLTMSTAVMIGAIGFVYSRLFHQDVAAYLPFLAVSLVLWNFINMITAEGATCFSASADMIRSQRMAHTVHPARVVVRNLLVLAHNLAVIVVVFIIYPPHLTWSLLSELPALALWALDASAVALLLGLVGARYRDVPPIVGSVMQIAFYVTPIMWSPAMLMNRGLGLSLALIKMNPFYGLLQIVRGPLLGQPVDASAWTNALCYSVFLVLMSFLLFVRARPRIPYWV
ncbi:MAG: ABC transporter permease [Rhodospirillales bacterium]|nr:ABC transporter permease [Rhodospirillales bacterium]MDE2319980.1 ABC transporter permease [Rhodospirillales bacterium]